MIQKDIRSILETHTKLTVEVSSLSDDSDLYDVGLSSLTTVNLMLALEDHFDVEFEDRMLARATFQSIDSLGNAIEELLA